MSFDGTANPEQLAVLTRALDEHCRAIGLDGDHPEREVLARRVMSLFNTGTLTLADLKMALADGR